MSCNGCRVLRKGCSETCVLRPCLQWIQSAEAQGHATVFVAKFFGRAGLMSFISAVPEPQRPALFQSPLFEAAGRTINPVNGAVGLLWTNNWHLCQAAVDTVLRGGVIRPLPELAGGEVGRDCEDGAGGLYSARRSCGWSTFSTAKRVRKSSEAAAEEEMMVAPSCDLGLCLSPQSPVEKRRPGTPSMNSEESVTTSNSGGGREREPRLLNLFL